MGRPLNKKYFGNRNIGSASTTADNDYNSSLLSDDFDDIEEILELL